MLKFVIHDPKRTDRYTSFTQELEMQGCSDYIIAPAIIDLKNPKRGISLAHKNIVSQAAAQGLDEVMIMEDDIKFTHPESLKIFEKMVVTPWSNDHDLFLAGLSFGNPTIVGGMKGGVGIARVVRFTGLHCYVVYKHYYSRFLQAEENTNLDTWLSNTHRGNAQTLLAYPILAITYPGYSDNVKKVVNYDEHFSKFRHFKLDT